MPVAPMASPMQSAAPVSGANLINQNQPGLPQSNPQNGYNAAMGSLNQSLQASNNLVSGGQMQLGQQLQQNQGNVQQNLVNKGLGNTTVAENMQQAPLQTYNQGMLNLQNAAAKDQMGVYGQAAQTSMQANQQADQYAQALAAMWQQAAAPTQQRQANRTNPGYGTGSPAGYMA